MLFKGLSFDIVDYLGSIANSLMRKSKFLIAVDVPMNFKLIPTLAYIGLLLLLIALGNWQLTRSDEKRHTLKQQEQAASAEIINFSATTPHGDFNTLRYKKVKLAGHYDVLHQFLIDNQINSGKAGYFVLTPFLLEDGNKGVLVNRGWIPGNQNRAVLPDIKVNGAKTVIAGRINNFPSVGIKLVGAEIPTASWPSVVQVVDSSFLAKKLGYPVFEFQVELDIDSADGYKREWQTTTVMSPEQHTAYALQWFALAITLTLLFIWYSFKKTNE